jgi:hypothetical protein
MKRMLHRVVVAVLAAVVLTAPLGAQEPDLEPLLAKATLYCVDFIDKMTTVVAEESYVQNSTVALPTVAIPGLRSRGSPAMSAPRESSKHRELKADFLIVKTTGELWTPFRDVFEVDHVPIRDRSERLARLFLNTKPDASAEEQAKAIAEESGRYNLGAVERTINNPIFALLILQPGVRTRFKFTAGRPDRKFGENVRVVEYVEEVRPTLIAGRPGEDMPAFGRFWIDGATGRVVKVELRVEVRDVKANLTTTFRSEGRLGMDVPNEFREEYDLHDSRVSGVASYTRFRKFDVKSSEELNPPAPDAEQQPK